MTKRTANRTQLSENWQPTSDDWRACGEIVRGTGVSLSGELVKFKDYHIAHGSLMASWSRAFRYWCRRAVEYAPKGSQWAPTPKELSPEDRAKEIAWYEKNGMHVPMKLRGG